MNTFDPMQVPRFNWDSYYMDSVVKSEKGSFTMQVNGVVWTIKESNL